MPHPNKNLVLAAMVFAVAMTFIDQTIVAIALPDLENDLSLSATSAQWIINAYLLLAFAHSTQTVLYVMAGVMAASFLVALRWLPSGRVEPAEVTAAEDEATEPAPAG